MNRILFPLFLAISLAVGQFAELSACSSRQSRFSLRDFFLLPDSTEVSNKPARILFLGNSLSAGYGLDKSQAYPAIIQQKIDSLGWKFRVINAGLSGDTSAGGLRRINWLLRQQIDVLVLELGGNDGLRGIPIEETRKNLQAIIDSTRKKNPNVKLLIAGMQVPPNMGERYAGQFLSIFEDLGKQKGAVLIPFLLEGVGGIPELNLPDRVHPTAEGHAIVAENVWKELRPLLEQLTESK
jgi:acyl-CoA thioesterase-1